MNERTANAIDQLVGFLYSVTNMAPSQMPELERLLREAAEGIKQDAIEP